jgi:hypothetical protein
MVVPLGVTRSSCSSFLGSTYSRSAPQQRTPLTSQAPVSLPWPLSPVGDEKAQRQSCGRSRAVMSPTSASFLKLSCPSAKWGQATQVHGLGDQSLNSYTTHKNAVTLNTIASHVEIGFSSHFLLCVFAVLGLELRIYPLSLLTSPFCEECFAIGSQELFAQAGFEPRSS